MKNPNSLLAELLQLFPELRAQVYYKATLTAISHAMEDLVLAGTEQPLIIANFQQERYYRQESARYQRISQRTDRVYILAEPETDFNSAPAPYATIGLEQTDELAQEWHLAIVGENYSACLICREYPAPVGEIDLDSARQFRGFWTFDPAVSRQAAALLLQRIGDYRPDLANQIDREKQRGITASFPLQSAESISAELFVNRLVTYLQASQHQQVKAYQRIVGQERQERLVNQFTTAIRQSLTIEDIFGVTIREVSQLFGQSRCLLSRLPLGLATPEHLASHPHFQPLLNQGQIVSIADVSQDSGIQSHPDLQAKLAQAQIEACLLVPIFIGAKLQNEYHQQCLGVLELHHSSPYSWSIADRDLLRSIVDRVGSELLQVEAFVNLRQMNQQLAAIKQTQNNLIAIVGHELRTPLSTIQVCLESLDAEPDMPTEYQQSMVEIALSDSERLRKLIEDFLLLSRLESNLATWQMEPINLADSISIAVSHLQAASQPRDLPKIVVDLSPALPLILADNEALFQLLSKLLDNACKFTPPTGMITLKIAEANPPAPVPKPTKPMLEVEIVDTGCGIEPDRLEQIFDRFHQEEGFLRRAVGGAGLGLSICRQLVHQLGGQIWATSQGKGQGSQFYVTLPVLVN
jgi:DICT domain-containing protein/nitrogen-specific signal transduction histidine kinase